MESILPFLFWAGVIIYFVVFNSKKQLAEKPKTLIEGKKPQELMSDYEIIMEELAKQDSHGSQDSQGSQERPSQENQIRKYVSNERTNLPTVNKEKEVMSKKEQAHKQKLAEIAKSMPSIKATKPPKPEKPKKDEFENYKMVAKRKHPLKEAMENPEALRNAFILSEVFKKKF